MATAWSATLSSNDSGGANYSQRIIAANILAQGEQVRVTFVSSTVAAWSTSHCSIGVRNTTYNTLLTPVELTFSGLSGFSLSAGQSIVSDWVNFDTVTGQDLVVVFDTSANGNPRKATSGGLRYFKSATQSWDQATPTGSWTNDSQIAGVSLIEVQNIPLPSTDQRIMFPIYS